MWLPKREVDLSYRVKVNKGKCGKLSKRRGDKTSLKLGLDKIQEVLVLALMIVLFVAVFYSDIELLYKIIVSVMVFSIIFLVGLVSQAIERKESKQF
jgi:L-asparagine transporter-like permease